MNKLNKGFTLIELLVAITILGILSTLGITQFGRYFESARDTARVSDLETINTAVASFYAIDSKYPEVTQIKNLTGYVNPIPIEKNSGSPFLVPEGVSDASTAVSFLGVDIETEGLTVTNSPMEYIYAVGASDNGLARQAYELSTAFESEDNMKGKAATDKGDDPFRFERGTSKIGQRSNVVCDWEDVAGDVIIDDGETIAACSQTVSNNEKLKAIAINKYTTAPDYGLDNTSGGE